MSASPVVVFDLGKVLVDFDYGIAAVLTRARCAIYWSALPCSIALKLD
jgi:FMN phosphatase YigB (HAD superfamily)